MKRNKAIWMVLVFVIGIVFSSCASSKRGCDGQKKRKVEMGFM